MVKNNKSKAEAGELKRWAESKDKFLTTLFILITVFSSFFSVYLMAVIASVTMIGLYYSMGFFDLKGVG